MAALALGTLLGVALVGGGLWLRSEHEAGIRRERDRARREQALVARVDAIHLDRATLVEGRFNPAAERRFNNARADRDYESAFREAGLGAIGDDPAGCGGAGRGLGRARALGGRAGRLGGLRRRRASPGVGPGRWRGRPTRTPGATAPAIPRRGRTAPPWPQLARTAPVAGQPAPFLVALGERLQDLGGDGTAFLARVHQEHPDDFWAALTLARALQEGADPEAAVAPYRRALELRGDSAAVYNNLGLIPFARRDWHEAYDYYGRPSRSTPTSPRPTTTSAWP